MVLPRLLAQDVLAVAGEPCAREFGTVLAEPEPEQRSVRPRLLLEQRDFDALGLVQAGQRLAKDDSKQAVLVR